MKRDDWWRSVDWWKLFVATQIMLLHCAVYANHCANEAQFEKVRQAIHVPCR